MTCHEQKKTTKEKWGFAMAKGSEEVETIWVMADSYDDGLHTFEVQSALAEGLRICYAETEQRWGD